MTFEEMRKNELAELVDRLLMAYGVTAEFHWEVLRAERDGDKWNLTVKRVIAEGAANESN